MVKYRFSPHTADAKFRAFGRTLEEAFSHAALAVASLMWEWDRIPHHMTIPVSKEGADLERLLVDFLEEIIYLLDTHRFLLGSAGDVSIEQKDGAWSLQAMFKGDTQKDDYEIYGDVKAITYNEIDISVGPPYVVQVVVDV